MGDDQHESLWDRCRRIVDGLDLPSPFDVTAFVAELGRRRGRPVTLLPVASRPDRPCGLLVTTSLRDYILYAADTTPLHQQHILLHEAAHLLCGHDTSSPAASLDALLPHLPPALVRSVLGRAVYTEPQEQEAELVASLILSRVTSGRPGDQAPTRLATLFGARSPRNGEGRR